LDAGAAPGALSHHHIDALDALVTAWRGQGPVALPGGTRVARGRDGTLAAQEAPAMPEAL
jgi:tRNA(Ile)-lysidine synthase